MPDLHDLVAKPGKYLTDTDPAVRRLAVSACSGRVTAELAEALGRILETERDARVRAEAAEVLAEIGRPALEVLLQAAHDDSGTVREAAATGLGELADDAALPWLMEAAATDTEKLVREAAVAALGAIGNEHAVPLLLDLVASGPPQVRRRCVVALSVFDGLNIEAAIRAARDDRNPMVREAAEMVIGR